MYRTRFTILLFFGIILFNMFSLNHFCDVIKKPKYTCEEKNFVVLEQVKVLPDEVSKDEILYEAFSIASSNDNRFFAYDRLQTKVFIFDDRLDFVKSFGRLGQGPGEFFMKKSPVFLSVGRDNKLYANDINARKLLIFSLKGESLGQVKVPFGYLYGFPVDSKGNIYFIYIKPEDNKNIYLYRCKFGIGNENALFPSGSEKVISFKAEKEFSQLYENFKRFSLIEGGSVDILDDSTFILLFRRSAILDVVKNGKLVKRLKLWPKILLKQYKMEVEKINNPNAGSSMFAGAVSKDWDTDGSFLVSAGRMLRKGQKYNAVYHFGLSGNLKTVFLIPWKDAYPRIFLKKNNKFYARKGDKFVVYK